MKILTTYERSAPDPWMAVDDDTYDGPPAPVGTGATEYDAIAELLEKLADRSETAEALSLETLAHALSLAHTRKLP